MQSEILEGAKKELPRLLAELRKTQLYRRYELVMAIIAEYEDEPSDKKAIPEPPKKPTKEERIKSLAVACVRERADYTSLSNIQDYLGAHGIKIEKPALSAYLTGFKDVLQSDRKLGWSIKGERPKQDSLFGGNTEEVSASPVNTNINNARR